MLWVWNRLARPASVLYWSNVFSYTGCLISGEKSGSVPKPACVLWALHGCVVTKEQAMPSLSGGYDFDKENNR